MSHSLYVWLVVLFGWGSLASAATPKAPPSKAPQAITQKNSKRNHQIKLNDYFSINYLWGGLSLSRDGRQLAFVESRWGRKKRNADLWVMDTKTRRKTRLTFHKAADVQPTFSPDGRWIYFLTRRVGTKADPTRGKRQVWRIKPSGDRMMPVTRAAKGVAAYQLSRDGKRLYYQTNQRKSQKGPFAALRKRFTKLKYGHDRVSLGRLWKLNLETWHVSLLHKSKRSIRFFSVSPDETRIAMQTAPDRKLVTNEGWSRIDIYDIKKRSITSPNSRQWREQAPSPYGWLSELRWGPDGRKLSFRVSFDGYPAEIYVLSLQGTKVTASTRLKRHLEAHLERGVTWHPLVTKAGQKTTSTLCYIATRHARNHLMCVPFTGAVQGPTQIVPLGEKNAEAFVLSADGKQLAMGLSGKDFPIDLFFGPFQGANTKLKRLTKINPQIDTWKLPNISTLWWKSKDGTKVHGVVELPPGKTMTPKKPMPLLVLLHGGPTWSVKSRFRFGYHGRTRFAAQGWVTLSPNYRGSTGYGDKFLVDLIGHKNDRDIADILSGVEELVRRGVVDPKRMAIAGWSNGGYLVNCLITKTTRFKAASSGAGVFDTTMQWMIEDTPGHVINFSQGLPWQKRNSMRKSSPLYNIHKAKTPTIIHVGERDARVPVEHSRAMYRSLRRYLKVPSQLIVYPGVFHGLRSRKHRMAKMSWDYQWFKHYVLRKPKAPKPKSPPRKPPTPPKKDKAPKNIKAS